MTPMKTLTSAIAVALAAMATLPVQAATEAAKQAAIDKGLAWLATQQQADGRWVYDYGSGDVAATGAVLLAFIEEGHTPTSGTAYSTLVANGLNWIWQNGTKLKDINVQPAGNPDTNGNGQGIKFNTVVASHTYDMYNTGVVLPAIVKAGAASTVINSPGSPVHGRTYGAVIQDVVDYLAWGQTDSGWGRGGWRYGESSGGAQYGADNSVAQWPALAMLYAQGAGAIIPGFVKSELKIWLQYSQHDTTGGAGYTDWWSTTALRTGSWLVQAALAGNLSDAEIQSALNYINSNWNDGSNFGNLYGMWAIYKGLEAWIGIDNETRITNLRPGNCGGDVDNPNHGCNWWEDMNQYLVANQTADGWFNIGGQGSLVMRTAWGVNILQAVQVRPPEPTPEPATLALLAIGLTGLTLTGRRRKTT